MKRLKVFGWRKCWKFVSINEKRCEFFKTLWIFKCSLILVTQFSFPHRTRQMLHKILHFSVFIRTTNLFYPNNKKAMKKYHISEHFFLPFATCAGIGDGHWRAALALLAVELRELDVADSGRSKDEQRCKTRKRKGENSGKNFMFIVSSLSSFLCNFVTGAFFFAF